MSWVDLCLLLGMNYMKNQLLNLYYKNHKRWNLAYKWP